MGIARATAAFLLMGGGPASVASPTDQPSAGTAEPARRMTLRDELAGLLQLAEHHWPVTAAHVRDHLAPRAKAVTHSNQNLDAPSWATTVGDPEDTFVELGGDVAGIRIPHDHEYGQYAELYVVSGTAADVEAAAGPLKASPRIHFDSPEVSIAYPVVNGHHLRVLVEIASETRKMVVKVHYEGD